MNLINPISFILHPARQLNLALLDWYPVAHTLRSPISSRPRHSRVLRFDFTLRTHVRYFITESPICFNTEHATSMWSLHSLVYDRATVMHHTNTTQVGGLNPPNPFLPRYAYYSYPTIQASSTQPMQHSHLRHAGIQRRYEDDLALVLTKPQYPLLDWRAQTTSAEKTNMATHSLIPQPWPETPTPWVQNGSAVVQNED